MEQPSEDIRWHPTQVLEEERIRLLHQTGCVVWLTGLSGSGKSTIARSVEQQLIQTGHLAYVLDGDNLRHGLCGDLGFSPGDRNENIRRVSHVAALFADAGVVTIVSFISPYRAARDAARALLPKGRFLEIHIDTPLSLCEKRDPKGLYKKARAGLIDGFTGLDAPYEPPLAPELTISTATESVESCADQICTLLRSHVLLLSV